MALSANICRYIVFFCTFKSIHSMRSVQFIRQLTFSRVMFISLIVFSNLPFSLANHGCPSDFNYQTLSPKYQLIERCYRSRLGVAARANFTSLAGCQRLGIERKGLALNFSPAGAKPTGEYSCEVLKCAEADGGLSLANDTGFDYYSLYGRPLPNVNATCVPTIGMFHLLPKRLNYTEAREMCRNMSSVIPDVSNEQRTDALALVLAGASVEAAFVGLVRKNNSNFVEESGNGNSLDCTTFRAWAPGHPRKNYTKYDCMLITRHKTWLSTPCKKRFRVLCELIPGGPYKKRSIFASRRQNENDKLPTS